MSYTMGSLFAGIGGFDLGFSRAGFDVVWQVEIDAYAQKVLAKHFPEAKRYGDIRDCGRANLVPVDVICGGFPCQDISNAGLRAGMDGERSGLWGEMHRIISELRPHYVLVENVAALLGRGIGRVLGDLAEIGYDAEWEVISAADLGAPHLRERVWIMAYPNSDGCHAGSEDKERAEGETCCAVGASGKQRKDSSWSGNVAYPMRDGWDTPLVRELREADEGESARENRTVKAGGRGACAMADTSRAGRQELNAAAVAVAEGFDTGGLVATRREWEAEPDICRVADGIPARVDRLKGLGNAVVPQIPEMFAIRIRRELEAR